jgi:hypothetical protein
MKATTANHFQSTPVSGRSQDTSVRLKRAKR